MVGCPFVVGLFFCQSLREVVRAEGLVDGIAGEGHVVLQTDVGGGTADLDGEGAGKDVPLALAVVGVEAELFEP